MGNPKWVIQKSEAESRRLRRSLYIVAEVKPGDVATDENIRAIRPGEGLSPEFLRDVYGKKFNANYKKGTPISWDCFDA